MSPADYKSGTTPTGYNCSKCKATGVRLWRPYNQCAPDLLCYNCALASESKTEGEGRAEDGYQIGWLVPAVPTESGLAYWGYSAIPQPGVVWWKGLPERIGDAKPVERIVSAAEFIDLVEGLPPWTQT